MASSPNTIILGIRFQYMNFGKMQAFSLYQYFLSVSFFKNQSCSEIICQFQTWVIFFISQWSYIHNFFCPVLLSENGIIWILNFHYLSFKFHNLSFLFSFYNLVFEFIFLFYIYKVVSTSPFKELILSKAFMVFIYSNYLFFLRFQLFFLQYFLPCLL